MTKRDIHILVASLGPPRCLINVERSINSFSRPRIFALSKYSIHISLCEIYGIYHPLNFSSSSADVSSLSIPTFAVFDVAILSSRCESVVGKTHLLDYTTHEVPLPLFGLGHDWACTFRGAPLPPRRQARAPEFSM